MLILTPLTRLFCPPSPHSSFLLQVALGWLGITIIVHGLLLLLQQFKYRRGYLLKLHWGLLGFAYVALIGVGIGLGWYTSIYAGFSFIFFVAWLSLMAHVLRNEFRMNPDLNGVNYQPTYVSRSFFPLYSYNAKLSQLQVTLLHGHHTSCTHCCHFVVTRPLRIPAMPLQFHCLPAIASAALRHAAVAFPYISVALYLTFPLNSVAPSHAHPSEQPSDRLRVYCAPQRQRRHTPTTLRRTKA